MVIPSRAGDVLYRKYRYRTAGAGAGDMERDGDDGTLLDGEERGSFPEAPDNDRENLSNRVAVPRRWSCLSWEGLVVFSSFLFVLGTMFFLV